MRPASEGQPAVENNGGLLDSHDAVQQPTANRHFNGSEFQLLHRSKASTDSTDFHRFLPDWISSHLRNLRIPTSSSSARHSGVSASIPNSDTRHPSPTTRHSRAAASASPVLRLGKCVGLLAVMVLASGHLNAQTTRTWDGGTNGTSKAWNTAANWVGDVNPSSGDNLLFDNVNVAASIPSPLTVSATSTFGLITFDNVNNKLPATLIIDSGGSGSTARAITVNSGVTLANSTTTIQFRGSFGSLSYALGANNTFTISSGGTLQFDSVVPISGSYGITKNGSGTLSLAGTNTYTGSTTINAGTLTISGGSAITDNGTVILANTAGVNFNVNASETIGTLQGGGTTGGTVNIGAGFTLTVNQTSDQTFAGVIAGSTGALTKTGANTLTLSGLNTYNGTTTISAGNLTISGGNAIADTGTVTLANTAGVGFNVSSNETIASLQGGGSTGGIVTVASGQTLTVAETGTQTFAGSLQGSGNFTKSGAGTLTLNGNNTNSGAISVTAGTLTFNTFNGSSALSSSVSSLSANSGTISLQDGVGRTITISNGGLSLTGSTMVFELGSATDRLTFTNGGATLSGTNTIQLADLGSFTAGTYTLISAASGLNGGTWALNSSSAPTGFTYTLSNSSTTLSLVATANSAYYYWKGANGSTWGTANNWTSDSAGTTLIAGAPGSNADVVFAATGASNLSNTLGSNYAVSTVTLNTGGITIGGANTLTANTASASAFRDTASSGTNVISANLAGSSAGFNKSGAGTLTLSGANTFGGGLTLSAGTLNLNSATAPGNGSITITGGTLDNTSGTSLTLTNNNTQSWNGDFAFTGTKDLNMGTGTVALGASRTVTVNGGNLTVGGIISGTSFSLTKTGAGALILGGANSYTGGTTLSAGTLAINNSGSGGTTSAIGTGTLTISGGTLDNTSGSTMTLSTNNVQNWNGDFAFTGTNDLNLGNGAVTMNANRIVTVNGGNLTVGGAISGSTASFTLTKAGAGTLILGGANTYTGATTVSAGTLQTSAANVIADTSALSVSAGAAFVLGGNETVASIAGAGNYSLGANTLTFGDSSSQTVSGIISGSGGSLVKNGSGSITLSGNNTYSGGTTISAGTIKIGDNNALGSGSLKFNASGTGLASSDATDRTIANALGTFAGSSAIYTFGSAGTGNLTFTNTTSATLGSVRTFTVNNSWTSFANAFTGSGHGITKNGTGTLILLGANSYTGATTINAGTLQIGNGGATGSLSTSSAITINGTLTFNRSGDVVQGTDFSTTAIGGTGSLVQNGTGNLTLNAANNYSGGTTLNSGTLNIKNASAIGSGTLTINGGTLNNTNGSAITLSTNNVQNWNGDFAFTGTSDLNLGNGAVTMNGSRTVTTNGGNLTVGGTISGSGGLTKNGTGTMVLSGSNTYSGITTVNSGTLKVTSSGGVRYTSEIDLYGGSFLVTASDAVNDNAAVKLAGGTLALDGTVGEVVGALTLSANSTLDMGTGNAWIAFASLTSVLNDTHRLNIYNYTAGTDAVYFIDSTNVASSLNYITFYSDLGVTSLGSGFFHAPEVHSAIVPEPSTYVVGLLLLGGVAIGFLRQARLKRGALR